MPEPFDISALIPWLALVWFGTLVVAFGNLAIDEFRGTQSERPMLSAVCDWIASAAVMSISVVSSELHSRNLISAGAMVFLIVMSLAIALAGRMAAAK